jgi:hypothetical protein
MTIGSSRLALRSACLVLLATTVLAAPKQDRQAPTRPTNLRVTAVGAYTASLARTPSTDNGGFHYVICCSPNGNSQNVPAPASGAVFTAGLEPNRAFSLRVYAVDAANNWSQPSNPVSGTTTADTVPPTTPAVSVVDVGARYVSLLWSATDNGPNLWYDVFMNGSPIRIATRDSSAIVPLLAPSTAYTFAVRARDFVNQTSPVSDPVAATTLAPNPDDGTPPTTPRLGPGYVSGCEVQLVWTESTDDFDPPFAIEYEVYLNGVHVDSTALRDTRRVVYADRNGVNTFAVAAVDSAGNRSALSNEVSEIFDGCEL